MQLEIDKIKTEPIAESISLDIEDWALLIDAISNLLWPLLVLLIVLLFKEQISSILSRLKKGKIFGQEIELEDELKELDKATNAAKQEIVVEDKDKKDNKLNIQYTEIEKIIKLASLNPESAIINLAILIEKQLINIVAAWGGSSSVRSVSVMKILQNLETHKAIPSNLIISIRNFWKIRNRIVHSFEHISKRELLSFVDSGLAILRMLYAVPIETNIIYNPGVTVYSDKECVNAVEGVKGVILETTSAGGIEKSFRIYPTTKTNYIKGKRVSWEWNLANVYNESWYHDPDDNSIKYAWTQAGEFIGAHVD